MQEGKPKGSEEGLGCDKVNYLSCCFWRSENCFVLELFVANVTSRLQMGRSQSFTKFT